VIILHEEGRDIFGFEQRKKPGGVLSVKDTEICHLMLSRLLTDKIKKSLICN
jgi:hypothetical protein